MIAIKAHFDGKVFVPEAPVDFPRGQKVVMHVEATTDVGPPAVGGQHFLDWVVDHLVDKTDRPADGSAEHDHYIYGTPKRQP